MHITVFDFDQGWKKASKTWFLGFLKPQKSKSLVFIF